MRSRKAETFVKFYYWKFRMRYILYGLIERFKYSITIYWITDHVGILETGPQKASYKFLTTQPLKITFMPGRMISVFTT